MDIAALNKSNDLLLVADCHEHTEVHLMRLQDQSRDEFTLEERISARPSEVLVIIGVPDARSIVFDHTIAVVVDPVA